MKKMVNQPGAGLFPESGLSSRSELRTIATRGVELHRDGCFRTLLHFGKIGPLWGFCIKYIIPAVLTLIVALNVRQYTVEKYGNYPVEYQAAGVVPAGLLWAVFLLLLAFPYILEWTNLAKKGVPAPGPANRGPSVNVGYVP